MVFKSLEIQSMAELSIFELTCGNSVLAKYLIDYGIRGSDARSTCYYFFNDHSHRRRSAIHAMYALLHQLISQRKHLIAYVDLEHENDRSLGLPSSSSNVWEMLMSAAQHSNKEEEVVFILDGLDRCKSDDRWRLIRALEDFERELAKLQEQKSKKGRSRIKFLARRIPI